MLNRHLPWNTNRDSRFGNNGRKHAHCGRQTEDTYGEFSLIDMLRDRVEIFSLGDKVLKHAVISVWLIKRTYAMNSSLGDKLLEHTRDSLEAKSTQISTKNELEKYTLL